MIVAIINQTNPVGVVRVLQFRDAVDVATAVAAYVNSYSPPRNPADYLGVDTTWVNVMAPTAGTRWAWDFDNPGLVEEPLTDRFDWCGVLTSQNAPLAVSGATPFAFEDILSWSGDLGYAFDPGSIAQAQIRIWGQYEAAAGGGGGVELRIRAGADDLSATQLLADAAVPTNFAIWTTVAPTAGRKLYRLQCRLNDAGASFQLEASSMVLLKRRWV